MTLIKYLALQKNTEKIERMSPFLGLPPFWYSFCDTFCNEVVKKWIVCFFLTTIDLNITKSSVNNIFSSLGMLYTVKHITRLQNILADMYCVPVVK